MKKQENYDKTAFEMFASIHPIEAFEKWPDRFMEYLKKEGYNMTKRQVEETIKESEKAN